MNEVTNGPSSGGTAPNRRGWRLPDDMAPGRAPGFPGSGPGYPGSGPGYPGSGPGYPGSGPGGQRPRGATPSPWQSAPAQPNLLPKSVAGLARAVNVSTVQNPNKTATTMVTFRLEQYDARAGRTGVLTVRLFEENALGFVNDGDWVEVTGKIKHGILKADKAVNHTSQAQYSRSKHLAAKIIGGIALFLILAFILGIGVSILLSVLHNR